MSATSIFKEIKWPGPYPSVYMELEEIIKEFTNVGREITSAQARNYGAMLEVGKISGEVESIRGGIRVPHLHYGSKIRILDQKTWASFAKKATDHFSQRLAKAQTVTFDQLNEIADVVNTVI